MVWKGVPSFGISLAVNSVPFFVTFSLSSGLVGDFGREYLSGSFDGCRIVGVDCILWFFGLCC